MKTAELEIGIHRTHVDSYQVELRHTDPDNAGEIEPERGGFELNQQELLPLLYDPAQYGEALAKQLFGDAKILAKYQQVKATVEAQDQLLRLRLFIGRTAVELHEVRWELLRDPDSGAPLVTSERVHWSRYMTSQDWRRIRLRKRTGLKAVVAVAAPHDLARYQLADVDVDGEIARAQTSLAEAETSVIGKDAPLTIDALIGSLRAGADILYLVCHGQLPRSGGPKLYLQAESGGVSVVSGDDFALRISELRQPPRLIVLASCQSAGTGKASSANASFQSSLAPRLAEAGVPAIVAMQGNISMDTVERAMPVFFRELMKDGQIDQAMAVARASVRERSDYWMPVLFMRLRGGRIWYEAGFAGDADFEKWQSIVHRLRRHKAVAILGAGLASSVFGDSREIAQSLAEAHSFPLAPHQRDDLPQVAQYLSVIHGSSYPVEAAIEGMRTTITDRDHTLPTDTSLPRLLDTLLQRPPDTSGMTPYHILASLPISVYVCATPDTIMFKALKEAGKKPTLLYADWRQQNGKVPQEPTYRSIPSPETPIVYHILGLFGKPGSLVLTEDDYFDYLLATASCKLVPRAVRSALVDGSLLFLGFQLMDWSYRVIFRLIQSLEGMEKKNEKSHVGVQVSPDETMLADVNRACRYLEKYFDKEANLGVFWGSVEDFLSDLREKLQTVEAEKPPPYSEGDEDEWTV